MCFPFGWKISPYIYQSLGMVATQEIRSQGVPGCQYIDDRHAGQRRPRALEQTDTQMSGPSNFELAAAANHVAVCILRSLGCFLNLAKSIFIWDFAVIQHLQPFLCRLTRSRNLLSFESRYYLSGLCHWLASRRLCIMYFFQLGCSSSEAVYKRDEPCGLQSPYV